MDHATKDNAGCYSIIAAVRWVWSVFFVLLFIFRVICSPLSSQWNYTKNSYTGWAVTIPSVKELHRAGIQFEPREGGISSIEFDEKMCLFSLPAMKLDVDWEVIIRNLLAYESVIHPKRSPLIFTECIELMRAVIQTPEDVNLLVPLK
ncbi:hypothetical protein RJT34_23360 [Clitoria ternatea]|uniref:Uncharacterized protein n=1 Tax=Clitoria ternatea TaxID=43366 RepID=A0AAN9IGG8_CLITE